MIVFQLLLLMGMEALLVASQQAISYQMNCLSNGRFILSNKKNGHLISNNARMKYPEDKNPYRLGWSLCFGQGWDNAESGCGGVMVNSVDQALLVSKVRDDNTLAGDFASPTELNGLINTPVAICSVSSSSTDPYCLGQSGADAVFAKQFSRIAHSEAFMIIPATDASGRADPAGAYVIKQISKGVNNKLYTHDYAIDQNGKDAIDSWNPTYFYNQFYIQKSSTAGQYFIVNRKFCTTMTLGEKRSVGYESKATANRGSMELMFIKAFPDDKMDGVSTDWRNWNVNPPIVPLERLFDRCAFKTVWQGYHPGVQMIHNAGGNLAMYDGSSRLLNDKYWKGIDDSAIIVLPDTGDLYSASSTSGKRYWSLSTISHLTSSATVYKDTETFALSCYCKPGTCWDKGTSWCLACPPGEYQLKDEESAAIKNGYKNYISDCSVAAPSDLSYPYIAPQGACSQVHPGCYASTSGSTNHCPAKIMAGCYSNRFGETSSCPNVCPPGRYSREGATDCAVCSIGTFSAAQASSCTTCPSGTYSDVVGAATCSNCNTEYGRGFYISENGLKSTCRCFPGYTGDFCDIRTCDEILPSVSLLGMYLIADKRFSSISRVQSEQEQLRITLSNVLSIEVDLNGNDQLSNTELLDALKSKSIYSDYMKSYPVWCASVKSTTCYKSSVAISVAVTDALKNFYDSSTNLDGSGSWNIYNMKATYPSPAWNDEMCGNYDQSIGKNEVVASWSLRTSVFDYDKTYIKTCGYINGNLSPLFNTSAILLGTQTTFTDTSGLNASSHLYKRLYCIAVHYKRCWWKSCSYSLETECSVGLLYDGTPIDLIPSLSLEGVGFSYTDTSVSEIEFNIFHGNQGSAEVDKQLIVGIPYSSTGCGRISQHISFVDKINAYSVGAIVEYGIRSLQQTDDMAFAKPSAMSIATYRIPFLVELEGSVETISGTGVSNVIVTFSRVHPETNTLDPNFSPVKQFVTDKRGHFSGEIRVSDIDWFYETEYFNITASKIEELEDGSMLKHVFEPPFRIIPLMHMRDGYNIKIIDNTTITIRGVVLFDPKNVNGFNCPFEGVPVYLVDNAGTSFQTTSAEDGSFSFSITRGTDAKVFIPPYGGHTWRTSVVTAENRILRTESPTRSPTRMPSSAPTREPTRSPTNAPSFKPTNLPTRNPTTAAPSRSPTTRMPSKSPTPAPSKAPTRIPTRSPTTTIPTRSPTTLAPSRSPTITPSRNPTFAPTRSPATDLPTKSPSYAPSQFPSTQIPSRTPTMVPSFNPSYAPSLSPATSAPTRLPTFSPSQNPTIVPSRSPATSSPTRTPSVMPSANPTLCPTFVPTTIIPTRFPTTSAPSAPTMIPTQVPSNGPTRTPSVTPTLVPTFIPTRSPTSCTPTRTPTIAPTKPPSFVPTQTPTQPPVPTVSPSQDPTFSPSRSPTSLSPSRIPTALPSIGPSKSPATAIPTIAPSVDPTIIPSRSPTTAVPSRYPTVTPSFDPSLCPTRAPSTTLPTRVPTTSAPFAPTVVPTQDPTDGPTRAPSTASPSRTPTCAPSLNPTLIPTRAPTTAPPTRVPTTIAPSSPTIVPTQNPTDGPTRAPTTFAPSRIPSAAPSFDPTLIPTRTPTSATPSRIPTMTPSQDPSITPTRSPTTMTPTKVPSITPTQTPTQPPASTASPSQDPTLIPSRTPTSATPTRLPTVNPSMDPTTVFPTTTSPTRIPTVLPSQQPTFLPSAFPTTAIPTSLPTCDPTFLSTLSPSLIPTVDSTAAPTVTPTFDPTTSQPSGTPSIAPSGTPTEADSTNAEKVSQFPSIYQTETIDTRMPSQDNSESSFQSISPTLVPSEEPTDEPTESPSWNTLSPTEEPTNDGIPPTVAIETEAPTDESSTENPTIANPSSRPSTFSPSKHPTTDPTSRPTEHPTFIVPTSFPTSVPTAQLVNTDFPTSYPSTTMPSTSAPTFALSETPTIDPTSVPTTLLPTEWPSSRPSQCPTHDPTRSPTVLPSQRVTTTVTSMPITDPTYSPTRAPTTQKPTKTPTVTPTKLPTMIPTKNPSCIPTRSPTIAPTRNPTYSPSRAPTTMTPSRSPTKAPSLGPTVAPTRFPTTITPSRVPTIVPSITPTNGPTRSPATMTPTRFPTRVPSPIPSRGPTRSPSTISPTRKPTMRPSAAPSFSPTRTPTRAPTLSPTTSSPTRTPTTSLPTVIIVKRDEPQMILRYTFERSPNINNTVKDAIYQLPAVLSDGVSIDKGAAIFDGSSASYITLPERSLSVKWYSLDRKNGDVNAFSIELWTSIDADSPKNGFLFSFGPKDNRGNCSFQVPDACRGKQNVHFVIICKIGNPKASYYQDGVYKSEYRMQTGTSTSLTHDFLGKSGFSNSTYKGFKGKIEEFRIWFGIMSKEDVYANFLAGYANAMVVLSDKVTTADVDVTFYATTKQDIQIDMFGGVSPVGSPGRMFGNGETFQLEPTNGRCEYRPLLKLTAFSSVREYLPAMNYTVTLTKIARFTPNFAEEACVPGSISDSPCFCAPSLSPWDYFYSIDGFTQDITIVTAEEDPYIVTYTYRSGLCMTVTKSKLFSPLPGDLTNKKAQSCFGSQYMMLKKGQALNVTVYLLERYPNSNKWLLNPSMQISSLSDFVYDFNISDAKVEIRDEVSGYSDVQVFDYNTTFRPLRIGATTMVPIAVPYTISAGVPMTAGSLNWIFHVQGYRYSPGDISTMIKDWYIPIIGTKTKEVPNVYPISTNKDLIFMVIRDPPGGASQTIVHAGTTMEFTMSIENMHAVEGSFNPTFEEEAGFGTEASTCGGIGMMACAETAEGEATTTLKLGYAMAGSTEYLNSKSYKLGFTFSYDFATSLDPFIAGHPSDVIVGGGVDLIVNEALEVRLNYTDDQINCLISLETNEWLPARVTTYVMPVIEIEDLIVRIGKRIGLEGNKGEVDNQLKKSVETWQNVLNKYREHNKEFGANKIFTDVDRQWSNFVHKVIQSDNQMVGNPLKYIQSVAYDSNMGSDVPFSGSLSSFGDAFSKLMFTCQGTIANVITNAIGDAITGDTEDACFDFNAQDWSHVGAALNNICNQPDNFESSSELQSSSNMVKQLCMHKLVDGAEVPGGLRGDSTQMSSMFGYLEDSTKTLTFSANAPMTLSWTASSANSVTHTKSDTMSNGFQVDFNTKIKNTIFGVKLNGELGLSGDIHHIQTSGKSNSKDSSEERTITIVLDDNDQGDYFAIRVMEDPVYGTPVFLTVGGQSKCPGETATSRRESSVRITRIQHRCGETRNLTCDASTLKDPEDVAYFGAVILNESPTADPVTYSIGLASGYDMYYAPNYRNDASFGHCGTSGLRAGLSAEFMSETIEDIPYKQEIEVPFTVTKSGLCDSFKDIEVQIIATCEMPSSSSAVYQYPVQYDKTTKSVEILYDSVLGASQSSARFSVTWARAPKAAKPTFVPTAYPTAAPSSSSKALNADSVVVQQNIENTNFFTMLMVGLSVFAFVCFFALFWMWKLMRASLDEMQSVKKTMMMMMEPSTVSGQMEFSRPGLTRLQSSEVYVGGINSSLSNDNVQPQVSRGPSLFGGPRFDSYSFEFHNDNEQQDGSDLRPAESVEV